MDDLIFLKLSQTIGRFVMIYINEIAAIDDKGDNGRFVHLKNGTHFQVSETLSHILRVMQDLVDKEVA